MLSYLVPWQVDGLAIPYTLLTAELQKVNSDKTFVNFRSPIPWHLIWFSICDQEHHAAVDYVWSYIDDEITRRQSTLFAVTCIVYFPVTLTCVPISDSGVEI